MAKGLDIALRTLALGGGPVLGIIVAALIRKHTRWKREEEKHE